MSRDHCPPDSMEGGCITAGGGQTDPAVIGVGMYVSLVLLSDGDNSMNRLACHYSAVSSSMNHERHIQHFNPL